MKSRKSILILFAIGFAILAYPHVAQKYHTYSQKKEVNKFFASEVTEISEQEIEQISEIAKQCNESVFHHAEAFRDPFADGEQNMEQYEQCFNILDNEMFGAIEIPKLNLKIPIYLGATDHILSKGIGQVEGSSIPIGGDSTHSVLAGHRGMGTKAMFRNVDQLHEGDIYYIHTMNKTLTYQVYKQRVIYPDETESLEIIEGEDLSTLLTCHPYRHNYQRLLIHAKRID